MARRVRVTCQASGAEMRILHLARLRLEAVSQSDDRLTPPGAQISGGAETGQRLGQDRADGESSYRSHRDTVPAQGAGSTPGLH